MTNYLLLILNEQKKKLKQQYTKNVSVLLEKDINSYITHIHSHPVNYSLHKN